MIYLKDNAVYTPPTIAGFTRKLNIVTQYSPAERALASTFAKTLIARRTELGLTQEQVALDAGMDRNHYQLMEHARSDRKTNSPANPRLSTLIKLAKVFNCEVQDLLDDALEEYKAVDAQSPAQ